MIEFKYYLLTNQTWVAGCEPKPEKPEVVLVDPVLPVPKNDLLAGFVWVVCPNKLVCGWVGVVVAVLLPNKRGLFACVVVEPKRLEPPKPLVLPVVEKIVELLNWDWLEGNFLFAW